LNGGAIHGLGMDPAHGGVDAVHHLHGCAEVRGAGKIDGHAFLLVEMEGHLSLDDGAVGNARHSSDVLLGRGGLAFGGIAAKGERTLGNGVHASVKAAHRRHQKHAAQKALGVAHGGDGYIQRRARPSRRRHPRRDHDGCCVLGLQLGWVHGNAHFLKHVGQGADGKFRGCAIARAGEADNETIADQFVVAHAAKAGDVLEPHGMGRSHPRQNEQRKAQGHHRQGTQALAARAVPGNHVMHNTPPQRGANRARYCR